MKSFGGASYDLASENPSPPIPRSIIGSNLVERSSTMQKPMSAKKIHPWPVRFCHWLNVPLLLVTFVVFAHDARQIAQSLTALDFAP